MSSQDTTDKNALTVTEAATLAGVAKSTVYNAIRNGTLPARRVGRNGRYVRVSRADVIERWGA